MHRLAIHLLLLASLAPTLLTGLPVYHCRTTGLEGYVCGCCPREVNTVSESRPACCARHSKAQPTDSTSDRSAETAAPRVAPPPAAPGFCGCCEAVTDRFVSATLDGRSAEELAERLATSLLAAAPLVPTLDLAGDLSALLRLRPLAPPGISPVIEAPLPLLHAALRC